MHNRDMEDLAPGRWWFTDKSGAPARVVRVIQVENGLAAVFPDRQAEDDEWIRVEDLDGEWVGPIA